MNPLVLGLGPQELLIILAIVLLLFGGSRLAGLGKSTGRALKEFKEETKGLKAGETPPNTGAAQPPYETAGGSTFVPQPPQGPTPSSPAPQDYPSHAQPQQGGQPQQPAPYGQSFPGGPEHDARRDA